MSWRISQKTGCPIAALPGNARIKLRLPKGCSDEKLKRCPDGFDMLVLFTLLRLAQMDATAVVKLKSKAALIKELKLQHPRIHAKLNAALELWQHVTFIFGGDRKFRAWYPKQDKPKILTPPIKILKSRTGVHLKIDDDWMVLSNKFFVKVVHPLPTKAPLQNLILWAMTTISGVDEGTFRLTQPKTQRQLCRTIGLNHTSRNRVLGRLITEAASWFAKHGGIFTQPARTNKVIKFGKVVPADGLVFIITEPPLPKVKKPKTVMLVPEAGATAAAEQTSKEKRPEPRRIWSIECGDD
jgi:hypothetical protein